MAQMQISTEYAAGFFDGEGCVNVRVTLSRLGYEHYRIDVYVAQNNRKPLDLLAERWGGRVRLRATRAREHYVWAVSSAQARRFMRDVRPHLLVKAEIVDLALDLIPEGAMSRPRLTEFERTRRSAVITHIREVTQRRGREVA